jgi:hypothetical protein
MLLKVALWRQMLQPYRQLILCSARKTETSTLQLADDGRSLREAGTPVA